MNAISLTWFNLESDVIRHVEGAVRAERHTAFKTKLLDLALRLPTIGLSWVVGRLVTHAVSRIDAHAYEMASSAVWFEGAKIKFMSHIVNSGVPVGEELREHFVKFDAVYSDLSEQCRQSSEALRKLNTNSRLAAAFDRLIEAIASMRAASYQLLEIAEQSNQCGPSLVELNRLNRSFDMALSRYSLDEQFDPQTVALAADALNRMKAPTLQDR